MSSPRSNNELEPSLTQNVLQTTDEAFTEIWNNFITYPNDADQGMVNGSPVREADEEHASNRERAAEEVRSEAPLNPIEGNEDDVVNGINEATALVIPVQQEDTTFQRGQHVNVVNIPAGAAFINNTRPPLRLVTILQDALQLVESTEPIWTETALGQMARFNRALNLFLDHLRQEGLEEDASQRVVREHVDARLAHFRMLIESAVGNFDVIDQQYIEATPDTTQRLLATMHIGLIRQEVLASDPGLSLDIYWSCLLFARLWFFDRVEAWVQEVLFALRARTAASA